MTSARSLRALGTGALLALAACFPNPRPTTVATPQSTAAAISTAPVYVVEGTGPAKTIAPAPHVTPFHAITSVASPHIVIPSPSATLRYTQGERSRGTVALHAPHAVTPSDVEGPPKIFAIHINTVTIHSGETVRGNVRTTGNVSNVEIRIVAWSMLLPREHAGFFAASGVVPDLPFFVKGKYTLQVIAHGKTGSAERDIPITLR
jgi:hypothetical protein